jgi:peroxiredoxin
MAYNTVRFGPEDRDSPAPHFYLQSADEVWIASSDLWGSECVVLMFLHTPDEPVCRQFLMAVRTRLVDYQRLDARVSAIFPCPVADLPAFSPDPALTLLADPHKAARQAYAGLMAAELVQESDVLLFVLDRYGGIYVCLVCDEPDKFALEETLTWLDFIGIQCPE